MIELVEGFWVDPFSVTVVKKIDDDKCALWTTGQSALEGFVLDYPAEQVTQVITEACEEPSDEESDEDEPEEPENDEDDQEES